MSEINMSLEPFTIGSYTDTHDGTSVEVVAAGKIYLAPPIPIELAALYRHTIWSERESEIPND